MNIKIKSDLAKFLDQRLAEWRNVSFMEDFLALRATGANVPAQILPVFARKANGLKNAKRCVEQHVAKLHISNLLVAVGYIADKLFLFFCRESPFGDRDMLEFKVLIIVIQEVSLCDFADHGAQFSNIGLPCCKTGASSVDADWQRLDS